MAEQSQDESSLKKVVTNKRQPTKKESKELLNATRHGDMELISKMISKGVDMNCFAGDEEYQQTPLHISSHYGQNDVVKKLLTLDYIMIDCVDHDQVTPLHHAAHDGHSDVVSRLIEGGANVEARDADQATPLHHAAQDGHSDVVSRLIEGGANVEARDATDVDKVKVTKQGPHDDYQIRE